MFVVFKICCCSFKQIYKHYFLGSSFHVCLRNKYLNWRCLKMYDLPFHNAIRSSSKLQAERQNRRKYFRKIGALWSRQRNMVHIHLEFSCLSLMHPLRFPINISQYFQYILWWHCDLSSLPPVLIFNVSPFSIFSTYIAIKYIQEFRHSYQVLWKKFANGYSPELASNNIYNLRITQK